MGGSGWHHLLHVQRIAWVNDRQARNAAHHRQILCCLVARAIARRKTRQRACDLDVQVLFRNDLVNEIVGPSRCEHRIGRRKRREAFLGHAAGRTHQQLLGHAHLEKPLGIGLREQVQVGVLGKVGRHADDVRTPCGQFDQRLAERRRAHALAFGSDGGDHRRGREPGLAGDVLRAHRAPSSCDASRIASASCHSGGSTRMK